MADETTTLTADEKKAAEAQKVDAAVRARLCCRKTESGAGGCGGPMVPVAHKGYVHWCCVQPGCSRMLKGGTIIGWVNEIVAQVTGRVDTRAAEAAIRRYERSLKKTKS